jgi:sulfur carrier protein ThiS
MIPIVRVTNPIDPSRDRELYQTEFEHPVSLENRVYKHYRVYELHSSDGFEGWATVVHVSVNGHVWPRSLWSEVIPKDGDCIVIAPKVEGGNLLRTLAVIAVTAAAAVVSSGALAGLSFVAGNLFGAGTLSAGLLAGGILVGGNLLIGAFMNGNAPSAKTDTASYDPDGPTTRARSGTVIPKGYGRFRFGGNIISSFVDIEGPDQYINCLVCYGFGPARAINNIQINGKDLSTYQNVQTYLRMGSNNQTPIPAFNRTVNGYAQNTQCLAGVPVIVPGTGTLTQALQVDIQFPEGIFYSDAGSLKSEVITYRVDYRTSDIGSGAGPWLPVVEPFDTSDVVSYDIDGNPLIPHPWVVVATDLAPNSGVCYFMDDGPHAPGDPWTGTITSEVFQPNGNHSTYSRAAAGEWQRTNPALNQILVTSWREGYQDFVHNSNSPLYNRTSIYGLAAAKYDIQVTKFGSANLHDDVQFGDNDSPLVGQQMWIHSVNEISFIDLIYPNMILIGVRALATNQLSGQNINITAEIDFGLRTVDEGLMPDQLLAYEEDNPSCVLADMFLDDLYGGGEGLMIKPANIARYIDGWVNLAELSDELVDDGNGGSIRRQVFNGVFDNEGNLWDQGAAVTRMSRAQVVPVGRDYDVFIDQAVDVPVQMFTMGNIIMDSFTETWLPIDDRGNQVEIQFADRSRYYRQDNPLVYMDPALQDAGVTIKNTRIDGRGITIPAQAWHLARYKALSNALLLRTGSFRTDADGIACRPGNVVMLQHDVPQWGFGGRTMPGSTASRVLLDRNDIPFVTGTAYSVVVQHPALQRYSTAVTTTATSTSPPGITLALAAFDNAHRVTRAIVAGVDCKILQANAGSIIVSPPPGVVPVTGESCVLFDTDVMETAPVTGIDAVTGALILGTPLSRVPEDYSTYIYGVAGGEKWVRVTNIRKASEFRSTIEWIDYDAGVFVDATPIIGETSAQVISNPGVTSLTGTETYQLVGGSYIVNATLAWTMGPDSVGVAIYGQATSGTALNPPLPRMLDRLTHYERQWQMQIPIGETWTFRVVGFDAKNKFAPYKTAPTVSITALGIATNLLLGSSFTSGFTYWSISPRAGDSLVPTFADDGQAVYTVAGSALTVPQVLLFQAIPVAKWAVGQYLMLSAYFQTTGASDGSASPVGNLVADIQFTGSGGVTHARAVLTMAGTALGLTRVNTAATQIPVGTTSIVVSILVDGGSLSAPIASTMIANHLLLEIVPSSQTAPSAWAELDANGKVLDFFSGSSVGVRAQGSVLPVTSGKISYTFTDTTISPFWTFLAILWPDAGKTMIVDGSAPTVTGLTAFTDYWAFFYFDIVLGVVAFIANNSDAGTPAMLFSAYNVAADAACSYDGRVPLTPGGLKIKTAASGGSGGGFGGGAPGGGDAPPDGPIAELPAAEHG